MNDYETILAMLARAKIVPEHTVPLGGCYQARIMLAARCGNVEGYSGFSTCWNFHADGSLDSIEVSE